MKNSGARTAPPVSGPNTKIESTRATIARYLGIAGIFSWIAIALNNATQDSFATPNIWINLGILVGVTAFGLESEKQFQEHMLPAPSSALDTPPETAA